jgi:hypothetical protein
MNEAGDEKPAAAAIVRVTIQNTSWAAGTIRLNAEVFGIDPDDLPPEGWRGAIELDERVVACSHSAWIEQTGPITLADFIEAQPVTEEIRQRDAAWSPSMRPKKTVQSPLEQHIAFIEQFRADLPVKNRTTVEQDILRMYDERDENDIMHLPKEEK